jgi:putative ABC transport system ATP-binding protein
VEERSKHIDLFEVRDLAVEAGGKPLLEDVSFSLKAGAVLTLGGPSGVGKSSLLRVLAGLDMSRSGSIHLEGRNPGDWGWPCYRRRVNLLFQKPLLLDMSLRENLELAFAYTSAESEYPEARANALLERLDLSGKSQVEDPRSFSVGEQQRLCLVRSLLNDPLILLMDEPTSALDPESSRLVHELVESERAEQGMSVILVAHDRRSEQEGSIMDLTKYRIGVNS